MDIKKFKDIWNEIKSIEGLVPEVVETHIKNIEQKKANGEEILPIVYCDINETLLGRHGGLNVPIYNALEKLKEHGYKIVIASALPDEGRDNLVKRGVIVAPSRNGYPVVNKVDLLETKDGLNEEYRNAAEGNKPQLELYIDDAERGLKSEAFAGYMDPYELLEDPCAN